MYAFLSYQTEDKIIAGKIKEILSDIEVSSFMAHEDINVSEEWRLTILKEIAKADIFISLWSKNYVESSWCMQESGIASFRKNMTTIPLSIDGTIPKGFSGNIQSTKIKKRNLYLNDLMPGIIKANPKWGIGLLFNEIKTSGSFRQAEKDFEELLPYLSLMSSKQGKKLLEISINNGQVCHATLCAKKYIPPVFKKYGHLLSKENNERLSKILGSYAN